MFYDVVIVGAGVSGAMTARELARYDLKVALLEKCNDVAMGATKANSGIVHAGFDAVPGSLKAKLNVQGCAMMPEVCRRLHVPYINNGSLVVAFDEEEVSHLRILMDRGFENGVPQLRIIDAEELHKMEPNVSRDAIAALWAPTAGIVCPYELTIAATECAVNAGVTFMRNCEVTAIDTLENRLRLQTTAGDVDARYVVNAAGVFADKIASFAGDDSIHITARRGDYYLLDRTVGDIVSHTIFQCPSVMGKGVLVSDTVDGNIIIGPTAGNTDDKNDLSTDWHGLDAVRSLATKSVPKATTANAITSFCGLRAHSSENDFIIGVSDKNPRLINVAGIESPGLSAAPATARMVGKIIRNLTGAQKKENFDDGREAPVRFRHMTDEQRAALIAREPAYGRIICRCETVTEGEILDAIRAPAGARDVDGVKRRTRAGMGRCQGGFCGSKVVEILSRELNIPINEVTKFGGDSRILFDRTK